MPIPPGTPVRIADPAGGVTIAPHGTLTATAVDQPYRVAGHDDTVWVHLTPSFRGLGYDLASYPASWVTPIVPPPDSDLLAVAVEAFAAAVLSASAGPGPWDHLTCVKANALADILFTAGHDEAAAVLIRNHAEGDTDPADEHHRKFVHLVACVVCGKLTPLADTDGDTNGWTCRSLPCVLASAARADITGR